MLCATDIAISVPMGYYARLSAIADLMLSHGILICGDIIEPNFRGNVCVALVNFGHDDYTVKKGDLLAKVICEGAGVPQDIVEVDIDDHSFDY